MRLEKLPPIRTTLRDSDHPYLTGAWTPLHEEVDARTIWRCSRARSPPTSTASICATPRTRCTSRSAATTRSTATAMIHQLGLPATASASYRNRFVRTRCFEAEQEAGGSLWGGLVDPPGHLAAARASARTAA